MTDDGHTMAVLLEDLRPEQALALRAMFDTWEQHGKFGASRRVTYYVDGDGTFHPSIQCLDTLDEPLTDTRREAAEVSENVFDHDPLVREFRDDGGSLVASNGGGGS